MTYTGRKENQPCHISVLAVMTCLANTYIHKNDNILLIWFNNYVIAILLKLNKSIKNAERL